MRFVLAGMLSTVAATTFGCAHDYEVRDATRQANDAQAEARWLREEVQSLRASLAERDHRELEMWRAYVELAQRIGTVTRESVKPTEPADSTATAVTSAATDVHAACATPPGVATPTPRKSVLRAINQSQLTVREKRELLQSMRPPRTIDIVNPWEADK